MNMEHQFRNLDAAIEAQPMPPEFRDTQAVILCNDCSAKSSVTYHWLGLKCNVCLSYNTAQLQLLGMGSAGRAASRAPPADLAVPETVTPIEPTATSSNTSHTRPIPRLRRHSSDAATRSNSEINLAAPTQGRLSQSFNPNQGPGRTWTAPATTSVEHEHEDEDEDQDMIGFWRRVPRSTGSDEDGQGTDASDSETVSSSDEEEEEEDDDDENEFDLILVGHR
jgi:hypothetical protein